MKKETKELVRLISIAVLVMLVVPLAYRFCVYFWPSDAQPRPTLEQFVKEAKSEHCMKLLAKPIAKWTDAEVKSEPEIYAWLKGQGDYRASIFGGVTSFGTGFFKSGFD